MKIDRSNYEAWFLDAQEGTLSDEEGKALRIFLSENPDLEEEFSQFELVKAIPEPFVFSHRDALKKQFPPSGTEINTFNFSLFAIAYIEGDLNAEQNRVFEQLIAANTDFRKEFELYRQTVLLPENVSYKRKARLKKAQPIRRSLYNIAWIAAAAALALVLFLVSRDKFVEPEVFSAVDNTPPAKTSSEEKPAKMEREKISPMTIFNQTKEQPADHNVPVKNMATLVSPELDTAENLSPATADRILIAGTDFATLALPELQAAPDRITPISTPVYLGSVRNASFPLIARKEIEEFRQTIGKAEDISLWDLASAGVNGINKLTGTDMSLMASRDDEGDLAGISFSSRHFSLSTPVGRNK